MHIALEELVGQTVVAVEPTCVEFDSWHPGFTTGEDLVVVFSGGKRLTVSPDDAEPSERGNYGTPILSIELGQGPSADAVVSSVPTGTIVSTGIVQSAPENVSFSMPREEAHALLHAWGIDEHQAMGIFDEPGRTYAEAENALEAARRRLAAALGVDPPT